MHAVVPITATLLGRICRASIGASQGVEAVSTIGVAGKALATGLETKELVGIPRHTRVVVDGGGIAGFPGRTGRYKQSG